MSGPLKLVLPPSAIAATADVIDEAYPGVELWELGAGLSAKFVRVLGAYVDPGEAEFQKRIAYHARCLQLAEQDGHAVELVDVPGQDGTWWRVPHRLLGVVGCMMARVA